MEKLKNRYKDLQHFKTSVMIARNHFNGGEYINVLYPRYTHPEGITRERAKTLYEEEMISRKENYGKVSQIKSCATKTYRVDYANDYKTILEVIDILGQDYVDEEDFEYVLENAEDIYLSFYKQKHDPEEEKEK